MNDFEARLSLALLASLASKPTKPAASIDLESDVYGRFHQMLRHGNGESLRG